MEWREVLVATVEMATAAVLAPRAYRATASLRPAQNRIPMVGAPGSRLANGVVDHLGVEPQLPGLLGPESVPLELRPYVPELNDG